MFPCCTDHRIYLAETVSVAKFTSHGGTDVFSPFPKMAIKGTQAGMTQYHTRQQSFVATKTRISAGTAIM
jgi:hypothetical protein